MRVYFHAILVGETWPAFQSPVPDGGSNLRGKGGEKRKQAWLHNAKTRWEDVTQITHTLGKTHSSCILITTSKTPLRDVLSQESKIRWGTLLLEYKQNPLFIPLSGSYIYIYNRLELGGTAHLHVFLKYRTVHIICSLCFLFFFYK